jgi:putative addiction module CopG family antidote
MNLSLGAELEKYVEEKVRSGQFASPEEVVRGALALMKAQDALTPADVAELRQMLAPAIAQADRGELTPLDMNDVRRKAEATRASRRVG